MCIWQTDHPHAGGEYHYVWGLRMFGCGPSPRGWGIRWVWAHCCPRGRTIPTRVGNTTTFGVFGCLVADHPHAGGEYGGYGLTAVPEDGPSPRGWGIPLRLGSSDVWLRTIPTRVGNTVGMGSLLSQRTDHPHAGGEYPALAIPEFDDFGPSPRGWGILTLRTLRTQRIRTIPTRVGNTMAISFRMAV